MLEDSTTESNNAVLHNRLYTLKLPIHAYVWHRAKATAKGLEASEAISSWSTLLTQGSECLSAHAYRFYTSESNNAVLHKGYTLKLPVHTYV